MKKNTKKSAEHARRWFVAELNRIMDDERIDESAVAYIIGCHKNTVRRWASGKGLPSRDAALIVECIWPSLAAPLREIARVEEARKRGENRQGLRLVA